MRKQSRLINPPPFVYELHYNQSSSLKELSLTMNEVEEAGVPMKGKQQVVNERDEPQEVWIIGVALPSGHERPELVDLNQSEDS